MKPDDRGASHAGIGEEEGRATQWGHTGGHAPCPPEGGRPHRPLHPPPQAAWPGARPSPFVLRSVVGAAVSVSPKTQLLGPDPDMALPFTLVSTHSVWQTGGAQ